MNEQKLEGILAEARTALEPTTGDRERVRKKVIAALGASGVATAVAVSTAKTSAVGAGGAVTTGLSLAKLAIATVLIGGAVGLTGYFISNGEETPYTHVLVSETLVPAQTTGQETRAAAPTVTDAVENDMVQMGAPGEKTSRETATTKALLLDKPRPLKRKRKAVSPLDQSGKAGSDTMLFREISILKKASAALRDNRPKEAARMLAKYDREISKSIMSEERAGLGVLVLCAQGREKEARKAKQRFMNRSPNSPLAVRIRKRCARTEMKDD